MFGNYCGPNVFDIWLPTMTESTWKILKWDWKTPGIFSIQKSRNTTNSAAWLKIWQAGENCGPY